MSQVEQFPQQESRKENKPFDEQAIENILNQRGRVVASQTQEERLKSLNAVPKIIIEGLKQKLAELSNKYDSHSNDEARIIESQLLNFQDTIDYNGSQVNSAFEDCKTEETRDFYLCRLEIKLYESTAEDKPFTHIAINNHLTQVEAKTYLKSVLSSLGNNSRSVRYSLKALELPFKLKKDS